MIKFSQVLILLTCLVLAQSGQTPDSAGACPKGGSCAASDNGEAADAGPSDAPTVEVAAEAAADTAVTAADAPTVEVTAEADDDAAETAADAPAAAAGPSDVAGDVAKKLMMLSESDRQWVLQQVSAPVNESGTLVEGEGEGKPPDEAEDPWPHLIASSMFFLMCASLVGYLVNAMFVEWARYQSKHVVDQASFKMYLLYRFGYWYTWTPGSSTIVLCSLSLVLIVSGGVLLRVVTSTGFSEGLYTCWIWIAAPDGGGSAESVGGRLVGAIISMGGMLIFALLMSVVSEGVQETLHEFRAGSVNVIEGEHVVILGWSPIVPTLIEELCCAAESRGGRVIALLTALPKLDVEELIRESDINKGQSTVVVRSGDPANAADLERVAAASAASIIVLSRPGLTREAADARTLNVMLRLQERHWPRHGTCIVQCELVRNKRLFKSIAPGDVEVINIGDSVGELMVQCSRQSGLAAVMTSVLGFEGDEFYIHAVKGVAGRSFGEIVLSLPGVVVIGIVPEEDGVPQMLPPLDRILAESDKLIMLAEDISTLPDRVPLDGNRTQSLISLAGTVSQSLDRDLVPETIIVFGWNETVGAVMQELDKNVGPGSDVLVYGPVSVKDREEFLDKAQKRRNHLYKSIRIKHICGPLGARFQLEELPLERAHKVLILADGAATSSSEADGDMLAVLLQIRDILTERKPQADLVICPQVLDHSTVAVCHNLGVPDFVNSNELAGRILALVCEHPQMSGVISCFFGTECSICVADLSSYPLSNIKADVQAGVCFNQVALAAISVGDIALGWSAVGAGSSGPWEMNPKDRAEKRKWPPEARVVALRREQIGRVRTRDRISSPFKRMTGK